jgi:hypothetical protein
VDATEAYKELMRFVLLKRELLEQDIRQNPTNDKDWPRRVDNELRKWVTDTDLYTLILYKPRDVRRRVEVLERQKLVFRKKLRISPDLPDPVPEVEAAVDAWIVQRDAQTVVRKSKALMRKARKQFMLTQRAERYAMIADGHLDVDEWRRERILESIQRNKARKAEIEAKKRWKAERKAARARGETHFDDVFEGLPEVPSKARTNLNLLHPRARRRASWPSRGSGSREPVDSVWAPVDGSYSQHAKY